MDLAEFDRLHETLFTQLTPERQQTLTIQLMERHTPGAVATDGGGANDGDDADDDDDENDGTDEAYEPTGEGDENIIVADADTSVPAAETNAVVQAMQTLSTQITAQLRALDRRIDDIERREIWRARSGTTTPSTTPMRVPQVTPAQAQTSAVVSADVSYLVKKGACPCQVRT